MTCDTSISVVRPAPPRFRRLKRGIVLLLMLGGHVGVARWWWGYEAQRRLEKLIADAHARGEPILLEDFTQQGNNDPDNAAVPLLQALKMFSLTGAERQVNLSFDTANDDSPSKEQTDAVATVVEHHRTELQLVRQARQRSHVQWEFKFPHPAFQVDLQARPELLLGEVVAWAGLLEHLRGNDREAVEYLRDLLAYTTAVDRKVPTPSHHAMLHLLQDDLCRLVLKIPSASLKSNSPEMRVQVEALVAAMRDERSLQEQMLRAVYGARAEELDIIKSYEDLPPYEDLPSYFFLSKKPALTFETLRDMPQYSAAVDAARQPTWNQARQMVDLRRTRHVESHVEALLLPAVNPARTALGPRIEREFIEITERRVAVTALALQLFKSDHDRQLPESLEQLTPKYLPAVPSDPFRPDAGPLGYLPQRKPPAIYSVGLNMIDERGSMRPLRGSYGGRWLAQDAVFPLKP